MTDNDTEILGILRIAHETSHSGAGLSLRDALHRMHYKELRKTLDPSQLIPLIKKNPTLVKEWINFSQDKRTDGGYYLLEQGQIGQIGVSNSLKRFDSLEEAVAMYVVLELDFWINATEAG